MVRQLGLSEKAQELRKGIYKHHKGGEYEVLGVAMHSESLEELVIYKALYGERLTWVRPIDIFLEQVVYEGKKRRRFKKT